MRTISDALGGRDNNFDFLRLAAATVVIWWHAYGLSMGEAAACQLPLPALILAHGLKPGGLAVNVFFIISGFLVAYSFERSRNILAYLSARALRIIPALIPAALFAALIIGPLATRLPLGQYLASADTWSFLIHNSFPVAVQSNLPGVFETNPYPSTVNGPLWTLVMELRMYGLVILIGWLGLLNRSALFNGALIVAFLLYLTDPQHPLLLILHGHPDYARLAGHFLIGMAFYVNRSRIPLHGALVVTLVGVTAFSVNTTAFVHLFAVMMGYAVFWFAFHPRLRLHGAGRYGDFSYGLYIYHFPIQQSLVLYYDLPPIELALASLAAAFCFAYMSWQYIERPALGLKRSFSPHFVQAPAIP